MIERIYATRLLGVSNDDIRRLEADEYERAMIELARIAEENGLELDQVVREAYEAGERILRNGLEAELRRLALEFGMSEEEVRADYEAGRREYAL
ncbi:MAG: hypothetical protein IH957_12900 [Chloroflexi bacterium]|nr:hypothetical protein [Chloroflexota bacterium]